MSRGSDFKSSNPLFMQVDDFSEFLMNALSMRFLEAKENMYAENIKIIRNKDQWRDFLIRCRQNGLVTNYEVQYGCDNDEPCGHIINPDTYEHIVFNSGSTVVLKLYGGKNFFNTYKALIQEMLTISQYSISWYYDDEGHNETISIVDEKLPVKEMYPFLGDQTLEDYYRDYINSKESVLILIGPPGTGKTTFIRGLLHYAQESAIVSYSSKVLDDDYIFSRFLSGENNFMVLEDCDNFLHSRSEGNTMMHRFLNVADGLITTKGKKLIFSTNLPSVNDIDDALTRSGRCFDVLSFEQLNKEDALHLAGMFDVDLPSEAERYSIGDILNQRKQGDRGAFKRKVGFV